MTRSYALYLICSLILLSCKENVCDLEVTGIHVDNNLIAIGEVASVSFKLNNLGPNDLNFDDLTLQFFVDAKLAFETDEILPNDLRPGEGVIIRPGHDIDVFKFRPSSPGVFKLTVKSLPTGEVIDPNMSNNVESVEVNVMSE